MSKSKQLFTIKEIKYYLDGCRFSISDGEKLVPCKDKNFSLDYAIHELDDYEDGIDAVLERRPKQKESK